MSFCCLRTTSMAQSLASNTNSNGSSQSSAQIIGAEMNFSFKRLNACKQSLEKSNPNSGDENAKEQIIILIESTPLFQKICNLLVYLTEPKQSQTSLSISARNRILTHSSDVIGVFMADQRLVSAILSGT